MVNSRFQDLKQLKCLHSQGKRIKTEVDLIIGLKSGKKHYKLGESTKRTNGSIFTGPLGPPLLEVESLLAAKNRRLKCIKCSVGVWKCLRSFLQTPTPILDKIPGPMDARFLSSVGLVFGICIGRSTTLPNTRTG